MLMGMDVSPILLTSLNNDNAKALSEKLNCFA